MISIDGTKNNELDIRLRTITGDAMKAVLAVLSDLSGQEVFAVVERKAIAMERVGYPMPELHFVHEAALYELRVRDRMGQPL